MSQALASRAFWERLDTVRFRRLLVDVVLFAIRSLFLTALGVAILAVADYFCELDRPVRQAALGGLFAVVAIQFAVSLRSSFRRSRRSRLAVEVEQKFPALGQSLRTAVEYGRRSSEATAAAGARSSFVSALEQQVDRAVASLPLESLIPNRRILVALGVVVSAIGLLAAMFARDWEWQTAFGHALLAERPYTQLEVTPGSLLLDQGQELSIGVNVTGRTNRKIVLFMRPLTAPKNTWQERELSEQDLHSSTADGAQYSAKLPQINEPLAYYVAVGDLMSEPYEIAVRYPLAVQQVEVELTPPAYTGIESTTLAEGNVHAVEGTTAIFRFQLDRPPASASVQLSAPRAQRQSANEDQPPEQDVPLTIDGAMLTFQLELTASKEYVVTAQAADGANLPEMTYSIRVQPDRPPKIAFDQPPEVLEVHGLAEVLLRIRTQDDFGLTKAGIVFRVNNDAEHTLYEHDFQAAAAAANASQPATSAVLARYLPLEHFELTQKDSVTYYAFVEDNYPAGARRTETDLRFIDIRPFQRNFQRVESGTGNGGNNESNGLGSDGKPLLALGELISRQRTALNRTRQIARYSTRSSGRDSDSLDLSAVEQLVEFQQKLTVSTHELAEALQFYQIPGNDIYFKAEDSMRAAVDSLSTGNYETAFLQEQDALRFLIVGRDSVTSYLLNQPQRSLEELAAILRMQLQNLRNRRSNAGATEIADRLRYLSRQESTLLRKLEDDAEPMPNSDPEMPPAENTEDTESPADPNSDGDDTDMPERNDLERMQSDVAMEAADIQKAMEKIEGLSPLVRSRIAEALEQAEAAAEALDRGDSRAALAAIKKASALFRELARNVEGLTSKDGAEKIALAQQIAADIARQEQEFAEELSRQPTDEEQAAQLQTQAEQLAEAGKTLDDVLDSVRQSNEPADREAAQRVEELVTEQKLEEAVRQLEMQAKTDRSEPSPRDATEARELADRFEGVAHQLELLHRSIVAPRIADLMELERRASVLQEKLGRLETERQITDWHRDAEQLLDELKNQGLAEEAREMLAEALQQQQPDGKWNWKLADDRFAPPGGYGVAVSKVVGDMRAIIQELVLGKLRRDGNEQTPPQYDRLIERYFQVLSSER